MCLYVQHCASSIIKFGKSYSDLHKWLDEFAHTKEYGMQHRKKRHHLVGIEEAVKLFGEEYREPARHHIEIDLHQEGWKDTDHFPENEDDYIKMGLF